MPKKDLKLVPVRSGIDPEMTNPERPKTEAEQDEPKRKPDAVLTSGLKLNPFKYIKELTKIKVGRRKNRKSGVKVSEFIRTQIWQI